MMEADLEITLSGEMATEALGAALAETLNPGMLVFLIGQLGAGKTTLVRGLLKAMGHVGPVRSPTYALVESYAFAHTLVHHFDLYRLVDPEEIEFIGIRDFIVDEALCLIEWPERAKSLLPTPDVTIELSQAGTGRIARIRGQSDAGRRSVGTMVLK